MEEQYEQEDTDLIFNIVDSGGQRTERRKWIHRFDSADVVTFVASLSCYDEVLWEDNSVNAMTDQLQCFGKMLNVQALQSVPMILLLNKRDLFAEKIQRVPLRICESLVKYQGDTTNFEQTATFIRNEFTSLNPNPNERTIFTHITCALERDNIEKVFVDIGRVVVETYEMSSNEILMN